MVLEKMAILFKFGYLGFFPAVMVQEDYHSQNPYHNAVHAADVTQAMHCYLKEPKVRSVLTFTSLIHRNMCLCVYAYEWIVCTYHIII